MYKVIIAKHPLKITNLKDWLKDNINQNVHGNEILISSQLIQIDNQYEHIITIKINKA